jgi:S1-C subfamily serine protease
MEPVKATVVYRSDQLDIAVLKLATAVASLKPLDVADKDPDPGTRIYAIGSPGLGDQVLEQSITEGIVSAGARVIAGQTYVQHTAAINPGNSGGPSVDGKGHVIGINTLQADLQGVGFAIPSSVLREVFQGK